MLIEPHCNPDSNSMIRIIDPIEKVDSSHSKVELAPAEKEFCEPLHLAEFELKDQYTCRYWIDLLKLSSCVILCKMSYGGNFGTVNFIWKIPTLQEERDKTAQARTVLKIVNSLPEFHTRQMHYDFIDKYKIVVKSSNSCNAFHAPRANRRLVGCKYSKSEYQTTSNS